MCPDLIVCGSFLGIFVTGFECDSYGGFHQFSLMGIGYGNV